MNRREQELRDAAWQLIVAVAEMKNITPRVAAASARLRRALTGE